MLLSTITNYINTHLSDDHYIDEIEEMKGAYIVWLDNNVGLTVSKEATKKDIKAQLISRDVWVENKVTY